MRPLVNKAIARNQRRLQKRAGRKKVKERTMNAARVQRGKLLHTMDPENFRKRYQKREAEKLRQIFEATLRRARKSDLSEEWTNNRSFKDYDELFSQFFRDRSISKILAKLPRKREPLRILDDGAGTGNFLLEIKKRLKEKRISVETTAVVVGVHPALKEKLDRKEIDNLHEGPAELFIPTQPQHAIVSLYGGIKYALPKHARGVLLKYAHSLTVGGMAFIGTNIPLGVKDPEAFKQAVVRAFQKQGFLAEFHTSRFPVERSLPKLVLIIKRVR